VLTSASASTQTTILPTTRATLSMAAHGAIPKHFAKINPRYLTPGVSTIWMAVVSIACFVFLNSVSSSILEDSVTATGFGIAFYYGMTGLACAWYFRRELTKSVRNFVYVGLLPLIGGLVLYGLLAYDIYQQTDPSFSSVGHAWLGVGPPVAIAMVALGLGVVLMFLQRIVAPDPFFRWKREVAPPGVLEEASGA
jgi:amino acid transporter